MQRRLRADGAAAACVSEGRLPVGARPRTAGRRVAELKDRILAELRRISLPNGEDIVSSGFVKALAIESGKARFVLEVPPELGPRMEPVRAAAERAVASVPGVSAVSVVMTAHDQGRPGPPARPAEPPTFRLGRHPTRQDGAATVKGVDRVIAVASGKGGVGKSTVASNLAVALQRQGRSVGLLDADMLGPSIPKMMGTSERPESPDGKTLSPILAHGVKMMSIGSLVREDEPVVWRGPMLMGALQQMLTDVDWSGTEILIVDLPPGTGDVQLTLCQKFRPSGAVIVCTPQDVALIDARRAIAMFRKLDTPVLGIVENMSTFACPACGTETHIFGRDGAKREAERLELPFLGTLPILPEIMLSGDSGVPAASGPGPAADAFEALASRITMG